MPDPQIPAASTPPLADPETRDPYIALRFPSYRRYFIGNACSLIGTQMVTYTVGYELYTRSRSELVLGYVGLVQVIPIILLALPSGQLADRRNRKTLVLIATGVQICLLLAMGISSRFSAHFFPRLATGAAGLFADPHVPILLGLLFINGICRAVNQPAKQSLLPMLVPAKHFPNAVTWNSSLFETTNVIGPMLGGFGVAALIGPDPHDTWAYATIYWFAAACQFIQWINIFRIHLEYTPRAREPVTLASMLAGVRFVFENKVVLGVMTLDLFAVLLGGATALLPVFADRVLHVGPIGLSVLRAAPSVGAVSMAVFLAHRRPMRHAGRNLLLAVAGFGGAIILFGLSQNFYLSLFALVLTGLFDNISVVVRQTLVQLMTPDAMRGRVNAVNSVFISTSNELGDFESGTAAHLATNLLGPLHGPMAAVAAGGAGTLLVVFLVFLLLPQVKAVKRLAAAHAG